MSWEHWSQASCMPDHCFCEQVRDGLIRQPSNTWSSLAFCLAGAWILAEAVRRSDLKGARPIEGAAFGVAVFLVGATSAFYHASLTFLGQWLDVQSMYLLAMFPVAVNIDALRPGKPRLFWATYLGINVALGVLLFAVPEVRRYAFGLALGSVIATEVLVRRRTGRAWPLRPMVAAGALQAIAFGIWALDISHTVCDPTGPIQGHALWHGLGAIASTRLWRYFAQ